MIFVLSHDLARNNAKKAIDEAEEGMVVTIKPKNRTLEQNALLHKLFTLISKNIEWAGAKRDVETWKRLLTAAWLRARGDNVELLPALDGKGVDIIWRHTSQLNVREMSELLEYVMAWATEYGVEV